MKGSSNCADLHESFERGKLINWHVAVAVVLEPAKLTARMHRICINVWPTGSSHLKNKYVQFICVFVAVPRPSFTWTSNILQLRLCSLWIDDDFVREFDSRHWECATNLDCKIDVRREIFLNRKRFQLKCLGDSKNFLLRQTWLEFASSLPLAFPRYNYAIKYPYYRLILTPGVWLLEFTIPLIIFCRWYVFHGGRYFLVSFINFR